MVDHVYGVCWKSNWSSSYTASDGLYIQSLMVFIYSHWLCLYTEWTLPRSWLSSRFWLSHSGLLSFSCWLTDKQTSHIWLHEHSPVNTQTHTYINISIYISLYNLSSKPLYFLKINYFFFSKIICTDLLNQGSLFFINSTAPLWIWMQYCMVS